MLNDPELKALEQEFNRPGSAMHVKDYHAKREAILARPPRKVREQEAARIANEAAEKDAKFARWGDVKKAVLGITNVVNKHLFAPLQAQVAKLETSIGGLPATVAVCIKEYVDRSLSPISERLNAIESRKLDEEVRALGTRLSTAETRVGGLALTLGRSNPEGSVELEVLMARVKALEERPVMRFHGVYRDDQDYRIGDCVLRSGSMWHCWQDHTKDKPGTSSAWQLTSKSGQKDAR